ncbi:MAG: asparaginase domain-containing protein, partial [Planifilum fulgidum]
MKRVLIITTGGTIAMGRDSSGAIRVLDENVLIRQQSALASVAHVDFFTFSNLPSVHLSLDHFIRLRQLILDKAKEYDGIVVTHGTDTLEETAYFLDLTLPHMDGYEVCKRIKRSRHSRQVKVVMLTSRASRIDRIRGAMAGCDAYLTKPV